MFRPWHFRGRTRELLSLAILRLYASVASTWVGLCHARLKVVALNLQWFRDLGASFLSFGCFVFEFWVFHFRVLGASFSSLGCFIFEIWVLCFRVQGASFLKFGCFVLRSSFSSGSFSKLPQSSKKSVKILLFVQISCNNKLPLLRTNSMANLTSLISGVSGRGHIQPIAS